MKLSSKTENLNKENPIKAMVKIVGGGKTVDFTHGSFLGNILMYAIPLMMTSMMQLLYHAADIIVVGRFVSKTALAAVGSVGSLTSLIVNVFSGLAVGVTVIVSQARGAKDDKSLKDTMGTTFLLSLIAGVLCMIVGLFACEPIINMMDSPDGVRELALEYLRMYFIGIPFVMMYNYGAAVFRAIGDTKRPMFYLFISGIVNVILNLVFVLNFHMGVVSVALATVISQIIALVLLLRAWSKQTDATKLDFKNLKIKLHPLKKMLTLGVPAGIQSAIFSVSNIVIQKAINSFGEDAIAGNSASGNIESFLYASMHAFALTALALVGQNMGAKNFTRIRKGLITTTIVAIFVGFAFSITAYVFAHPLISIYAPGEEAVISFGLIRLAVFAFTYFLCGIMEVYGSACRGMGIAVAPTIVSIVSVVGIRILWINFIFPIFGTAEMIYTIYPISWGLTGLIQALVFIYYYRKKKKAHLLAMENQKDDIQEVLA